MTDTERADEIKKENRKFYSGIVYKMKNIAGIYVCFLIAFSKGCCPLGEPVYESELFADAWYATMVILSILYVFSAVPKKRMEWF